MNTDTAPRRALGDLSGRVVLRKIERMELRIRARIWAGFFSLAAFQACVATFVVPAEPSWARYGFGGVAVFCVLMALVALWRVRAEGEPRS